VTPNRLSSAGWLDIRRWRITRGRLVALGIVAVGLWAGYFFWLRDSSLVAVDEVEVEGVTANAEEIVPALERVGLEQTTLHVNDEELLQAVRAFPTVASVSADATLPDKLVIKVTERLPVAIVKLGGEQQVVSADGFVLPGITTEEKLPPIELAEAPGGMLDAEGAAQAAIVGAVPDELREKLAEAVWDSERGGVVVELEGAPELRFGDGERADDKWQAVAAVLTEQELGSAAYLDVSVPDRPVAGG
jgi:cell division protein FtsQ